ncbi:MAG: DinB family protein [Chloroflexi bacterium]|nr:DinB family protein [Chloroflexota bacterium]
MENHLLQSVQTVLATTPGRWLNLAETLPVELLSRPPAPKEWSALECLRHLLDTEQVVFSIRLQAFLAGRDIEAFDPDARDPQRLASLTPIQLANEFAECRAASLAVLNQVTTADLSRTARHAELGVVTLTQMLHQWAAHDLMHTVQAERAILQPFIAGSGPWRVYFADHEVKRQE